MSFLQGRMLQLDPVPHSKIPSCLLQVCFPPPSGHLPTGPCFKHSVALYWPSPVHQYTYNTIHISSEDLILLIFSCSDIRMAHCEHHAFEMSILINFKSLSIHCLLLLPCTLRILLNFFYLIFKLVHKVLGFVTHFQMELLLCPFSFLLIYLPAPSSYPLTLRSVHSSTPFSVLVVSFLAL